MPSENPNQVKGWLFDFYPSSIGEMAVWVIAENGQRVRLTDKFQPQIYVSASKQEELERLASRFYANQNIASWNWACKYANPTDHKKSKVLEINLKDCRRTPVFTGEILKSGDYLRYEVHNCDLHGDRAYLFENDLFPLAFLEVTSDKQGLKYRLLDDVRRFNYTVPPLRVMKLDLTIAKEGKIADFNDPIGGFQLSQAEQTITLDNGKEEDKLLDLVETVHKLDPDIILTSGGDSYLFPYLAYRANANSILDKFSLSRDNTPFIPKASIGRTFFSYGRVFYKAPTTRLFGRIHIDTTNTFILNESSFQGLFEIARLCRVPLHTVSRGSIGSSMSSLQFYQAYKDDILLPRNKNLPEAFKSAYELLVADRGGFIYEPKVGIHDDIGEVDFSSMYPALMVKNNISAETVLCECCPDSKLRIPELDYNICEKRIGVVPKSLKLILTKRLTYKRLKETVKDPILRDIYDNRQAALKWILVCCFGYLGYRNSKFGTVDGHIGVCAFSREAFLKSARIAESDGFEVVHGIVDSLWLKKTDATLEQYRSLCTKVSKEIGVSLNFEGRYKWIVFLPSRMHPNIGVLNRYYGVMENGKLKVRGIEVRKHDTPKFIYDAQMDMLNVLASADNSKEFMERIPEVFAIVKSYRQKLLDGEVPIWDLMVTKHLSKNPKHYRQHVSQAIAAEQLMAEGSEVHAGNNVTFLFTDSNNKRCHRRVLAKQLIEKGVNADTRKYLTLLYESAANLLSFKGYTAKTVYDAINGQSINPLTKYLN
jgi:DNA polymerase elongation subunit (family B)